MIPIDTSRHRRIIALLGSLVLTALLGLIIVRGVVGMPAAPAAVSPAATSQPRREISPDVKSPAISAIDSPSPTCQRPVAGTGACYIQWNYMNVTAAASSYIISMTVAIDGRVRAYHAGFFQTSMFIPGDMTGAGYRVVCGKPIPGSTDGLGRSYSYTIRARETSGLSAANYGSVTCPADVVRLYLPLIRKR